MKKTIKEPPCFDGTGLDPIIYLRWVQILEDYFEAKDSSYEESFFIATQKLQGYANCCFKCVMWERALLGKPKIKHWSKLKSPMDARFNPY